MKKISLTLVVISCLISTASSFANNVDLNIYYSSLHSKSGLTRTLHPPTDITIINATSNFIFAVVPGSPVNDCLNSGMNDHIYGYNPNLETTYIVLQDYPYRNTFYADYVCRLAIVTAYGSPGYYRVNIDSDLCN